MVHSLFITRVGAPASGSHHEDGTVQSDLGGQWEWNWATPYPYRVLAAPGSGLPMPASPRAASPTDDFFPYLSYWASLRSFLTFSLGWARHDKGLVWWYKAGKPTHDARLQLLDAVWEQDGMLDRYLAWCFDRHPHVETGIEPWAGGVDPRPVQLSAELSERLHRARAETETSAATPYGKHLEFEFHVAGAALGEVSGELTFVAEASPPRALLVCESALGWYRSLAELGATLPASGPHAWRIDVFVRSIGFMGTYRRSWKTGLWFSGQHRFHEVGN